MIVITALALLVLVVVGAFFISGFGSAGASISKVNATQADCQSKCQAIATVAYNYDSCDDETSGLIRNPQVLSYILDAEDDPPGMGCALQFGACTVTIQGGVRCTCTTTGCS